MPKKGKFLSPQLLLGVPVEPDVPCPFPEFSATSQDSRLKVEGLIGVFCNALCDFWYHAKFNKSCVKKLSESSPEKLADKLIVKEKIRICWDDSLDFWIED